MSSLKLKSEWTKEIDSKSYKFKLSELWEYRDLLFLFVRRDFVSFYKQTIFGPIWFFVQPVITTITCAIVFNKFGGISTGSTPPTLFYLLGIILWNFFQESVIKTSTIFRDNAGIFGKVYFPRIITPISVVISNLFKFTIQFLLFIILYFYFIFRGGNFRVTEFIYLLPIPLLAISVYGFKDSSLGVIFKSYQVREQFLSNDLSLRFGLFNQIANHLEQAKIELKKETPVFSFIKPISVPDLPASNGYFRNVAIFLLAGVFLSTFLVIRTLIKL